MTAFLDAALTRALAGAYVLPLWWTDEAGTCECPKGRSCQSPGKHPLLRHGLREASGDPHTIRRWWQRWPQANVAVRTDDVLRIDIDLVEVAEALAGDAALPHETEVVRTPHGGLHIALAVSRPVSGRSLYLEDRRRLGDLKAAGGYVLVPPSRIGDRNYSPLSPDLVRVLRVEDPRVWLAELLLAFGFTLSDDEGPGTRQYEGLGGEIYEGQGRHNALVSYAGRVWVEGMASETLTALLALINQRQCRPPLPEAEVRQIAEHFIVSRERRSLSQIDAGVAEHLSGPDRPRIIVTNRHLHEIANDAWEALVARNDPPVFFQHAGAIAETRREDGRIGIVHLSLAGLRGRLDRLADWVRLTDEGPRPARPPIDVVQDVEALPRPLPVLRGVIGAPAFASNGTLVTEPGYQSCTRLYYEPSGEPVPCVPECPDTTDLKRAKQIIGQDWLADFPFVDEASRAHAIAAPLTAIVRELIEGPTPLFAIDAPAAGTGKGLLASGIGIIAEGASLAVMAEARSEDELRKRITALLLAGRSIVLFDNLRRRLDSATLAALLTATTWSDRLLGKTQTIELPNRAVWLATGNNLQMGEEIARRTVWIRLDAKVDRPWSRGGFRHNDLNAWLLRHRHELVWALLVLAQNWIAQGSPTWSGKPLGSYVAWASVVGGILEAAGVGSFLANREEFYSRADAESEDWRSFASAWWTEHGDQPVKVVDLLAKALELLPSLLARAGDSASERSLRTRLGRAIAERRDRRFGDLFVRKAGNDRHGKGALWCLEAAPEDAATADTRLPGPPTSAQHPRHIRSTPGLNADVAELADVVWGVEEKISPTSQAKNKSPTIAKQVPQHPQHPQTDSDSPEYDADVMRKVEREGADVPRCSRCGARMSVVRVGDICGRCQGNGG